MGANKTLGGKKDTKIARVIILRHPFQGTTPRPILYASLHYRTSASQRSGRGTIEISNPLQVNAYSSASSVLALVRGNRHVTAIIFR